MRRQTYLLIATFLGLAVASYVAVRQEPQRGMVRLRLNAAAMAQADHITITHGTEPALEMTRAASGESGAPWQLTGGHRADSSRVDRLLTALGAVNTSDMITQDTARFEDFNVEGDKGYGLRLQRSGRVLVHLRIGEAEAPSTYYLRDGDTVYRAQGELSHMVQGQAAEWEDRAVPTAQPDTIESLTVAVRGAQPLALQASGLGDSDSAGPVAADAANSRVWRPKNTADMPAGMRFDAGMASMLARTLGDLRAERLVDQDPGDTVTKLSQADAISWTIDGDPAVHTLRLGAAVPEHADERFAQVEGTVQLYTVSHNTAAALLKTWNDLRDLTLMAPTQFADVKSIALRPMGAKAAVILNKAEDGTFAVGSKNAPKHFVPDSVKVRARTQQTLLARAIKFVGPQSPTHGFANSTTGAIAVTFTDGTAATLQFGRALKPAEGVGYYARGSASKDVYVVSKALHDALVGGMDTLSKKPQPGQSNPQVAAPGMHGITPEMEAQIRAQMAAQAAG